MIRYCKARCLKEIYWKDIYHYPGDVIEINRDDLPMLREANVAIEIPNEIETMMVSPPENRVIKRKYTKRRPHG
jgi:hypothetical protein